jgi:hypothetical protein
LGFSNLNSNSASSKSSGIIEGENIYTPINFNFKIAPNDMIKEGVIYTFDILNNTQ